MTECKSKRLLTEGVAELGLALTEQQITRLLAYVGELAKWNRSYNLSAVRDPEQMIGRHLLDSLAVVPHMSGERIIDVGSGAGLPGIPLAICFPNKHFTLLDSNGKKTRFMFHAATQLGLDNVAIENTRVETFRPRENYHAVISRAFASLIDMLDSCRHLLTKQGVFLAMKGQYPEAELSDITKDYVLREATALNIPFAEAERHLLVIAPRTSLG